MITADKLVSYIEKKGVSKRKFAHEIGIVPESLHKYTSGGQPITLKFINKILAKYPDFQNELNGSYIKQIESYNTVEDPSVPYRRSRLIPFYDIEFTAGDVTVYDDDLLANMTPAFYMDLPELSDCKFGFRNRGESMQPRIKSGDWLVVKPIEDATVIHYGDDFGIVTSDYRLVKTIRKHPTKEDFLILKSDNPDFDPIELPREKVLKLYHVRAWLHLN